MAGNFIAAPIRTGPMTLNAPNSFFRKPRHLISDPVTPGNGMAGMGGCPRVDSHLLWCVIPSGIARSLNTINRQRFCRKVVTFSDPESETLSS